MTANLRILAVACCCMAATCEPPRFTAPLGDPSAAVGDPKLLGTWAGRLTDGGTFTLSIVPHEGTSLVDVVLVAADGSKGAVVLSYEGFTTTITGQSYLTLRAKRFADEFAEKTELGDRYLLARYEVSKGGLLALDLMLDDDALRAAADGGTLAGHESAGAWLVTASTPELKAFVQTHQGKLFRRWATLRRVKLDPPKAR